MGVADGVVLVRLVDRRHHVSPLSVVPDDEAHALLDAEPRDAIAPSAGLEGSAAELLRLHERVGESLVDDAVADPIGDRWLLDPVQVLFVGLNGHDSVESPSESVHIQVTRTGLVLVLLEYLGVLAVVDVE